MRHSSPPPPNTVCVLVACALVGTPSLAQTNSPLPMNLVSLAGVSRSSVLDVRLIGTTTDLAISRNENQTSLRAGLQTSIVGNRVVMSIQAEPLAPAMPNQALTLTALIRGDNLDGTVSFQTNGVGIPRCANLTLTRTSSSADTAIAKCSTATSQVSNQNVEDKFSATYRYASAHPLAGALEEASSRVRLRANLPARYHDMWWGGTTENGWGLSIAQHGGTQFNALFVYDAAGKSTWYVMPGGTWNADRTRYTGALYQPSGSPYFQYDASALSVGASVGNATIAFSGVNSAQLGYIIGNSQGEKQLQRQPFGTPETTPRMAVSDLWWGGSQQNGWGINIAQQGDTLFVVWFTYDALGRPAFIVMPGGRWTGTKYEGNIYVTESSPWVGATYDARRLTVTQLGTMQIEFSDASTAIMTYKVDGISRTNIITRQVFE